MASLILRSRCVYDIGHRTISLGVLFYGAWRVHWLVYVQFYYMSLFALTDWRFQLTKDYHGILAARIALGLPEVHTPAWNAIIAAFINWYTRLPFIPGRSICSPAGIHERLVDSRNALTIFRWWTRSLLCDLRFFMAPWWSPTHSEAYVAFSQYVSILILPQSMAAGILHGMEGARGIRAWRW